MDDFSRTPLLKSYHPNSYHTKMKTYFKYESIKHIFECQVASFGLYARVKEARSRILTICQAKMYFNTITTRQYFTGSGVPSWRTGVYYGDERCGGVWQTEADTRTTYVALDEGDFISQRSHTRGWYSDLSNLTYFFGIRHVCYNSAHGLLRGNSVPISVFKKGLKVCLLWEICFLGDSVRYKIAWFWYIYVGVCYLFTLPPLLSILEVIAFTRVSF